MQEVVIIGAGGHGREIAEILRHREAVSGGVRVRGFVDDREALHGSVLDGVPVLGGWPWLEGADRSQVAVIVAVGQPAVTRRLVARAQELGFRFASAISPLAHISPLAEIGEGVAIFPHVVINTGVRLGSYCTANVGVTLSHDTRVGPWTNINPGVRLAGNVTVGEGCYLGMGTQVIQGKTIGPWTVIGAGAVVVRDIPANVTAVGVPAAVIKTREEGWHER